MWINFIFGQKKFCIELSGEETFNDVHHILKESYGFKSKLSFSYQSKIFSPHDYFIPLRDIPELQIDDVSQIQIRELEAKLHVNISPDISQKKAIPMGEQPDVSIETRHIQQSKRSSDKKISINNKSVKDLTDKTTPTESKHEHKHKHKKHHKSSEKDDNNQKDEKHKHHKHHKSSGKGDDKEKKKHHKHKHSKEE